VVHLVAGFPREDGGVVAVPPAVDSVDPVEQLVDDELEAEQAGGEGVSGRGE